MQESKDWLAPMVAMDPEDQQDHQEKQEDEVKLEQSVLQEFPESGVTMV